MIAQLFDQGWRTAPLWSTLEPDRTGEVRAADGTTLHWQAFGHGPAVVLANGIGVLHRGLIRQIRRLSSRRTVVTWDYRGAGRSRLAGPDADVSMPAQARDVLAIVDHLGLGPVHFVGWSMGTQVGLEAIRARPQAIRSFVSLFGCPGRPFHARPGAGPVVEAFWTAALAAPRATGAFAQLGLAMPGVSLPLLRAIGFIAPSTDDTVFLSNFSNVAWADHRAYIRTMLALSAHDARDVLPTVRVPALVIGGERDTLTPPAAARAMAAAIPGAECVILPGASHYGLIEDQPVDDLIERFLARVPAP